MDADAEVTLVDAGSLISYGGCGIPYYISGDISDYQQLQETSFHMVRDADFFRECKHEDFPEPDNPVNTIILSLGISKFTSKIGRASCRERV